MLSKQCSTPLKHMVSFTYLISLVSTECYRACLALGQQKTIPVKSSLVSMRRYQASGHGSTSVAGRISLIVPAPYTYGYVPASYTYGYVPAPYTYGYVPAPYTYGYVPAPYTYGYVPAPYTYGYVPAPYTYG